MSPEKFAQKQVDWWNQTEGDMQYINCEKCRNKGYIMYLDDKLNEIVRECECLKERDSIGRLKKSGLGKLAEKCTIESFRTDSPWQMTIKNSALKYLNENSNKWFYIGGQSGCGKTHICTAISVCQTKKKTLKYVIWRDIFHKLQGMQFNYYEYQETLQELQKFDVLYIDDFLKSFGISKLENELNFAIEIINLRYINDRQTIISSEFSMDELKKLDSATAGRIIEKADGYVIEIPKDDEKNFRLR